MTFIHPGCRFVHYLSGSGAFRVRVYSEEIATLRTGLTTKPLRSLLATCECHCVLCARVDQTLRLTV